MLRSLAAPRVAAGQSEMKGWRNSSRFVRFVRFEYIAYQQFSVLHEGFRFWDVTNLTGEAKWGSYLEDPMPGAQLNSLAPMWVSMEALSAARRGEIPALSEEQPPLLLFHADHQGG